LKRIILILFVFICTHSFAQKLSVSSDKNPAIVGEQILIQYSIDTQGNNFKSPNFNGLRVLSGPNPSTQSSYSFVNGKSQNSTKTTYSYYLKATKEGTFNISPATIKVDGKTIKSKSYQLKIVKGSDKNKAQQKALSDNLFIKVDVSKRKIVVGEQIIVTYKLFNRLELNNTELSELPDLNGFWTKDLETSSRFKRDVIDGVPYNVATIKKSVLTAQKSGNLIIDPMELKCSIRVMNNKRNRGFFSNNYQIQEEYISSKSITINVTELPSPPPNFYGAVGEFTIKSEVDNTTANTNEAITYKLTITGTGNIELIEPLAIQFPEDFEVYDPKISDRIFEGGRKRSIKTFEYLLIPRYEGEYTINSSSLVYYNNKTNKYNTKKTTQHNLIINANGNTEDENSTINQQIIKTEKKDIHYIFTTTKLKEIRDNILNKNLFIVIFFLPIFLIILLRIYNTIVGKTDTNSSNWKKKKANKIALKRLKYAQNCINNNDFESFFEEIEKSLLGYFADKFKVSIADLSKETVSTHFYTNAIDINTKKQFIALLDECEFARYAPSNNKNAQMGDFLNKAKHIIIEVETALR
jgi:hypothetical protein